MDFGQWINHSTERNYLDCSTLRGEPNPMPKAKTDPLKTKAEIVKNLKESFDYCDATFAMLDDQKILSTPQIVFLVPPHHRPQQRDLRQRRRLPAREPHHAAIDRNDSGDDQGEEKTPSEMMKEMMERDNRKP